MIHYTLYYTQYYPNLLNKDEDKVEKLEDLKNYTIKRYTNPFEDSQIDAVSPEAARKKAQVHVNDDQDTDYVFLFLPFSLPT